MDSTLVGVIIGSGLTLFGSVLNQIILSRKEQKQWENQQIAETTAWTRNEQKKEKEYLREIYQNSLRSLSVFIALEEQQGEAIEQQKIALIDEVHKWVSMLLLRHSNSKLDTALNSFTSDQDKYEADTLRKEIIKLSNKEESLFLNELNDKYKESEIPIDNDIRIIKIIVNDNFRKDLLIEGVEIPQMYEFEFKLSKMSNSQREKLAEIYFESNKTIPYKFSLRIPVHNKGAKQINIQGIQWQAKLNPKATQPEGILSCWEKDYENGYKEAEESLKASQ